MSKYHAWDKRHKHIPLIKTEYTKKGSKWVKVNTERSIISNQQAEWVLSSSGLPGESSHRLEKKDRFGHSKKYDTFSSISPDKSKKSVWFVDYAQGDRNYNNLINKFYYDQRRYRNKSGR